MTDTGSRGTASAEGSGGQGLRYELFILALTLYSLVIMVLLLLPLEPATIELLQTYDNLICCVFLVDFAARLRASHPRRRYLIGGRGWVDLLGSIPSLGIFRYTALFRLFRLSRLARIARLLRQRQHGVLEDVLTNRGQYASFVTVLAALAVLSISSVLVLQFEAHAPGANITTGGDAVWWATVTITTVGYGDQFPVTPLGRLTGTFVMFAGLGIIGALASILASVLVTSPAETPSAAPATAGAAASDGSGPPTLPPADVADAAGALAQSADEPSVAAAVPRSTGAELAQLRERIEEMHRTLSQLVEAHQRSDAAARRDDEQPGSPGSTTPSG
jgi:voltage-gated potassium channel